MLSQAIQQVLFTRPLEKEVPDIVKKYGGSLYIPSPANCFQDSAGTTPCTVDSPVGYLKDLIGTNHATQGTAGYKPILRGKVKNWVKYSNDVTNSAWTNYWAGPTSRTANTTDVADIYGTYTANKLLFPSYTGTQYPGIAQDIATPANVPYVIQMWAKGSAGGERIFFRGSDSGGLNFITLTTTWTKYTLTRIDTAVGKLEIGNANYNNSCTIYVMEIMYETGDNISTYLPTTSAAASSSYGPYWLDFDGTDDRLQLGSVPFQLQDMPWVTIAALQFKDAVNNRRYFVAQGATAVLRLFVSATTGYLSTSVVDDAGVSGNSGLNPSYDPSNVSKTLTLRQLYNNRRELIANGVRIGTATATLGSSTFTSFTLGGDSTYLKGGVWFFAVGKYGLTEDTLKKIEKYAAKLSGAQL